MGEIAEMMLDGTLCEGCGEFLGDPVGYPRYCSRCDGTKKMKLTKPQVKTQIRVQPKVQTVAQHRGAPHHYKIRISYHCPHCGVLNWTRELDAQDVLGLSSNQHRCYECGKQNHITFKANINITKR